MIEKPPVGDFIIAMRGEEDEHINTKPFELKYTPHLQILWLIKDFYNGEDIFSGLMNNYIEHLAY